MKISYGSADQSQKRQLKLLLTIIFASAGTLLKHYRIEESTNHLFIRPSTSSAPELRHIERFHVILTSLHLLGLIKTRNARGLLSNRSSIQLINISEFDPDLVAQILPANHVRNAPNNVEEHIWRMLPVEITLRWQRFNPPLQAHIIECVKANLADQFEQINTQLLGQTMRSPILFTLPTIPVRLPDQHNIYDLKEILNIQQRDPANPARRAHPLTGEYFGLEQVIAAPDALSQLQHRIQNAMFPS